MRSNRDRDILCFLAICEGLSPRLTRYISFFSELVWDFSFVIFNCWPTWRRVDDKLLSLQSSFVVVLKFLAISHSESPFLTAYFPLWRVAAPLANNFGALLPATGIFSFCPDCIKCFFRILFARIIFRTLVWYLRAIIESVSPFRTLWYT